MDGAALVHPTGGFIATILHDVNPGGDIDLYLEIEPLSDAQQLLEKELRLYTELQKSLGEQKIDLEMHEKGSPLRSIDKNARESGLVL